MNGTPSDLHRLAGSAGTAGTVAAPPSRWKTRVLVPAIILVIIVALALYASLDMILPTTPVRVVPVVLKTVAGSRGAVTVQAPGWLEPAPHPYNVTALAAGTVETILVLEGDRVDADQVVARLIDEDAQLALRRAEAEVRQREGDLEAARAEFVAAKLDLEHLVEPNRAVAVATSKVDETSASLGRARADLEGEQATAREIRDELDRKAQLVETHAVAEAAVARLRLHLDAQEAAVRSAASLVEVMAARLGEAEAELVAARADRELLIDEHRAVNVAEANRSRAEGALMLATAQRDEAALRLDRMAVRSPVAGIIMQRYVAPGAVLGAGEGEMPSRVATVYDPAQLQVRVDVPLAEAANIVIGQEVEVIVEVVPDRVFAGRVTRIVHEADIQKNTVEVKVEIEEPDDVLKPEMLARAKFVASMTSSAESVRQRVFAPEALVRQGENGSPFVVTVTDRVGRRGRTEHRVVAVGANRRDGWVEIESGLSVGDLLVAEPSSGVAAGTRVNVTGEHTNGTGG